MPLTQQQLTNLRQYIAPAAIQCELKLGIPADLTAAQCILESAWLKIQPGHNCFGIKSYPGEFGRQLLLTREWFTPAELAWFLHLNDRREASLVDPSAPPRSDKRQQYRIMDWFATFPDLTACFAKRASLFLHGSYATYLQVYQQDHNFDAYVRAVAKVYATAPNYAEVIMSIIRMPEVVEALDAAKEALSKQLA